ncbi:hypothetical protein PHLGIDRAFT_37189 [Phlebiopsis gigantea 11061_1 CR5-6]|uniref:Uncharacterized protein n=1 Tax=Phlebiopsis gigantea (strain 11061_1 CR5-6) TaxID=745531 RepID=A0A0C3RTE0_PHLG1|nr:hypothetical protein PHLGIDRAFT_37189 [Phlebiopsis gigantea 11061_1 CR5-6]
MHSKGCVLEVVAIRNAIGTLRCIRAANRNEQDGGKTQLVLSNGRKTVTSVARRKQELIAPVGHQPERQQTELFRLFALLYTVIAAAGYVTWVYACQCPGSEKTTTKIVSSGTFDWARDRRNPRGPSHIDPGGPGGSAPVSSSVLVRTSRASSATRLTCSASTIALQAGYRRATGARAPFLVKCFSAVYPDNVGGVFFDGVYDSHIYWNALWDSNLADTHALLDTTPLASGSTDQGPEMAHKQNLASMMLAAAHKPIVHFPDVARGIAAVESRNVSACVDLRAKTPDQPARSLLAAASVCTADHVRPHFEEGVLPGGGVVCEPDELPFVGVTDIEDRELSDAMRSLGEALPVRW